MNNEVRKFMDATKLFRLIKKKESQLWKTVMTVLVV